MTPQLPQKIIPPNGSLNVTVDVNTLSQPAGPHRWTLTVIHDRGELPLEIRAVLRRDIEVTPTSIALTAPSRRPITVTVTDRRAKPLTVTAVTASELWLHGTPNPDLRSATLTIGEVPPGRHHARLTLHTDDADHATIAVPVAVTAKPILYATPERAVLENGRAVVRVVDRQGRRVVIDRIESDTPLSLRHAAGPGSQATVTIQGAADIRGTVRVVLREPERVTVEIPVGD